MTIQWVQHASDSSEILRHAARLELELAAALERLAHLPLPNPRGGLLVRAVPVAHHFEMLEPVEELLREVRGALRRFADACAGQSFSVQRELSARGWHAGTFARIAGDPRLDVAAGPPRREQIRALIDGARQLLGGGSTSI